MKFMPHDYNPRFICIYNIIIPHVFVQYDDDVNPLIAASAYHNYYHVAVMAIRIIQA